MAIKVDFSRNSPRQYTFPALYIDEQEGLILLLSSSGTGTVMEPGRSQYATGYNNCFWKMERLVPYTGRITLENK